jgi:hypothetical protein
MQNLSSFEPISLQTIEDSPGVRQVKIKISPTNTQKQLLMDVCMLSSEQMKLFSNL